MWKALIEDTMTYKAMGWATRKGKDKDSEVTALRGQYVRERQVRS